MKTAFSNARHGQSPEVVSKKQATIERARVRAAHAAETVRDSRLRFIRLPEAIALTGLSKATIYRLAKDGRFPRPVKIGMRASGWPSPLLSEFINTRTNSAVLD